MVMTRAAKLALFSLIYFKLILALKDFERCDVGKGLIHASFEYNCPKQNEVFRLKWFIRENYPYFKVGDTLKISSKGDRLSIYNGSSECDYEANARKILNNFHYTELEISLKKDGRFMVIAHGSAGFALICNTEKVDWTLRDIDVSLGYFDKQNYFYYDCPFRDNMAHPPE